LLLGMELDDNPMCIHSEPRDPVHVLPLLTERRNQH
jgi:hypothetical protein